MSDFEHDSSITEALESLSKSLPDPEGSNVFTDPPLANELDAISGLPPVDASKSLSLNGILDSLTSAIDQREQHKTAPQGLSKGATDPSTWAPAVQHEQVEQAALSGIGNQLLELQQQFGTSNSTQGSQKPKSKAAAVAEAIHRLDAEAKAAAAEQPDTAAAPKPDFTLLSEQVEQTLHERQVHDQRLKHGHDRDKSRPPATAPPNHGRMPGGGQTAPLPRPPPKVSSHMPKPPPLLPAPPVGPQPAHASLPVFTEDQLSAAGLRVIPSAAPIHPRPPQHAPPSGPQMQPVIVRPPAQQDQGPGSVHVVASGVHVVQPGAQASLQGFGPSHAGKPSTNMISKDKRQSQKVSPYPRNGERAPIVKPEPNRVHASNGTGKPETGTSAEALPDSSHGRSDSRNVQKTGQGSAPSSKVDKRTNASFVNSGNPLKRGTTGFTTAANSQVTTLAASRGGQNRTHAPSGVRSGAAPGTSREKPAGRTPVTDAIDKKDQLGTAAADGPARHAKSESLQSEKGLAQFQGNSRRPAESRTMNGKGAVTVEASRSTRTPVQAPKSNVQSGMKGEKGKFPPSQQKSGPQAAFGVGTSLAERQGMLQSLVHKKAAEGGGGERHLGAVERQARAREQKVANHKSSKKRERAAMQQQSLAEKSAMQAQSDVSHRYVQHEADKKRRRHSDGEDEGVPSRDAYKRSENGSKYGTGFSQHTKSSRQVSAVGREDVPLKHKTQRSEKLQHAKGAHRRVPDADEGLGKISREQHDGKSRRVMFSKRITQLDSSSEDDIEVPAQRTGTKNRSRGVSADAPSRHVKSEVPSGGAAANADRRGESKHGNKYKPSNTVDSKVSNLEEWGAEVDKLLADHQAYVGGGQSGSKHADKAPSSGVKREQRSVHAASTAVSNASDTRPGRVSTVVSAGRSVWGTAVQTPAVHSDVALHDMGAQTEEADVRSSSVQTPSVWGRSTQCQTDIRGVHQVLRVGVPVTVDTGCQSDGLPSVPESAKRGPCKPKDATRAMHALGVIEQMLPNTSHAQQKDLKTHCSALRQFILDVAGTTGVVQQAGAMQVAAEPEDRHTYTNADPRMPHSDACAQDERGGEAPGWEHEASSSDDEHEPSDAPAHKSQDPDLPPPPHLDTSRRSGGEDLDEQQSDCEDADMHEQDSPNDVQSTPGAGMQSPGVTPRSSERPREEDLEPDFDDVFGPTADDDGIAASFGDLSDVAVYEGSEEGDPAHVASPSSQDAKEQPRHRSRPPPSRSLTAADISRSTSYVSVMAHEEESDDEMVLEVSPGAYLPTGASRKPQGDAHVEDPVHAEAAHVHKKQNLQNFQQSREQATRHPSAKPSSVRKRLPSTDGCSDQEDEGREPRREVPLSAILKSQILGKLSKMLPKANLEVATAKRIIKKLEIDLRVDIKSHGNFVKHWIDEYLRDQSSLTAAASEAASEAATGTHGGESGGIGDGTGPEAAGGRADEGELATSDACRDEGLDAGPGNTAAVPSSTSHLPATEPGWESPAVSTGTPPGTPSENGAAASGKGLVSRMHGPGPGGLRNKVGEGRIYVPIRKTAKEKFRSTMTNEQLAEAKAAAAAALG